MNTSSALTPSLYIDGYQSESQETALEANSPGTTNFNGRMIRTVDTSDNLIQGIVLTATRPLRILYVFITELFMAIVTGLMEVLAYVNLDPTTPDTSRTPVLFLHGVNHNRSSSLFGQLLLRCYSAIRGQTLGSFYSISYAGIVTNGQNETFDIYADKVFRKARQIYKETHRFPILVGHSMGGIISTCLAKKCEEATGTGSYQLEDGTLIPLSNQEKQALRMANIVTLGSPFHGSYVADAVCDLHCKFGVKAITVYQDMMTDSRECDRSDRLTELSSFAVTASQTGKIRYYNVGSTLDEFVPEGYFVTTDPDRQYEVYHLGHLGLLWSPLVWSKVHKWLVECG